MFLNLIKSYVIIDPLIAELESELADPDPRSWEPSFNDSIASIECEECNEDWLRGDEKTYSECQHFWRSPGDRPQRTSTPIPEPLELFARIPGIGEDWDYPPFNPLGGGGLFPLAPIYADEDSEIDYEDEEYDLEYESAEPPMDYEDEESTIDEDPEGVHPELLFDDNSDEPTTLEGSDLQMHLDFVDEILAELPSMDMDVSLESDLFELSIHDFNSSESGYGSQPSMDIPEEVLDIEAVEPPPMVEPAVGNLHLVYEGEAAPQLMADVFAVRAQANHPTHVYSLPNGELIYAFYPFHNHN